MCDLLAKNARSNGVVARNLLEKKDNPVGVFPKRILTYDIKIIYKNG